MKKIVILLSVTTVVLFSLWFYQRSTQVEPSQVAKKQVIKKDPWQTFEKSPDAVVTHKTTKKELKKAKLKTRKPASVMANYFPRINGRRLYGKGSQAFIKGNSKLVYKNEYKSDWKEKLGEKLLAFQPKDVKLFIRKDDGLVLIERGGGRLVEKVTISFLHKTGMKTGYEAYVDSESGSIVKTWNQTRHENEVLPRFEVSL